MLEGLAMEDVGIFYGHWVYFSHFGALHQQKSGNPDYKALPNLPKIGFWV
jgi:hypothetical protein